MKKIIEKTIIPQKTAIKEKRAYNLICAVLLQAVRDYCDETPFAVKGQTPKYYFDKDIILSDLESPEMVSLSNGMSLTVASALRRNPEQIKENLKDVLWNMDGGEDDI